MKVLIVSAYDVYGGAGRAANRLHKALLKSGNYSSMLVQTKQSEDNNVSVIYNTNISQKIRLFDQLPVKLYYPNKGQALFSPSYVNSDEIINQINNSSVDVVHLHWVANGMIRIEDFPKIKKPLLWTLHDMWAFTGGCHYDEECGAYIDECSHCKVLYSNKEYDLSKENWYRKNKVFQNTKQMAIVGVSRWLSGRAKKGLFKDHNVLTIPNLIDSDFFKPYNKIQARSYLDLPVNKKLILFGAISVISDRRKGFLELLESLNKLENKDAELVVFGHIEYESLKNIGFNIHCLGEINDDERLIKIYSAADVMVVPSTQESFGQTASEAMACGTPVVAFAYSGLLDIVEHKINGYLAKPFDSNDLARGIDWVLTTASYLELCNSARKKVENTFSENIVLKQYMLLYKTVLNNYIKTNITKNVVKSMSTPILNSFIHCKDSKSEYIHQSTHHHLQKLSNIEQQYIIYGKGTHGQCIKKYLGSKFIAFVDQTSDLISMQIENSKVYHPENLKNMTYDKIIISVLGKEEEIIEYLTIKLGIDIENIVKLDFKS